MSQRNHVCLTQTFLLHANRLDAGAMLFGGLCWRSSPLPGATTTRDSCVRCITTRSSASHPACLCVASSSLERPTERAQHYVLLKQLGQGDFCTVYLSKEEQSGEMCALKVATNKKRRFSGHYALLEHVEAAFSTELENLRSCRDHRLFIQLCEPQPRGLPFALSTEAGICSVLELCLAVSSDATCPLPLAQTNYLLAVWLLADAFLHKQGIAHGDPGLKNMVVTTDCRVRIIDLCADGKTIAERRDEVLIAKTLFACIAGTCEEDESFYNVETVPHADQLNDVLGTPERLIDLYYELAHRHISVEGAISHAYWQRELGIDLKASIDAPEEATLERLRQEAMRSLTYQQGQCLRQRRAELLMLVN